MVADIKPYQRAVCACRRICARIAGNFKSAFDRNLPWRDRIVASIKAVAGTGASGFILLLVYTVMLIPFTPSISDLRKAKAETPSILMSADGKLLAVLKRVNRQWVELDEISPHVVDALIATEDHRFYEHHGVDLRRTAAGILRTLQGDPEGGSTLTQQLARNLYPEEIGRTRSITRKLKELITALKIEYAYSKKEILLTYLNTMPFLYNAFGIEMGARTYFDKSADKLTVLESATLVGMLKGTSYYNPVLNPDRAVQRRNVVLSQMAKRGALSKANFDTLKARPLRLDFERQPEPIGPAPHLAEHVRKWLVDWADRNDYNLYSDGLVIHTTIDSRMQAYADLAVARRTAALQVVSDAAWGVASERPAPSNPSTSAGTRQQAQAFGLFWKKHSGAVDAFVRESAVYRNALVANTAPEEALARLKRDAVFMAKLRAEKMRLETGFVAIDPTNGHVMAWVGSRDFAIDQFDHVAQARRQPGSTFKPFVYGAALEQGMPPERRFTDEAVEIPMSDGTVWRPTDATPPSGRPMTAREGLMYSRNTITAQVMQEVGPKTAANFARRLGVNQSKLESVPALALGTSPVTLLEMVSSYSTIASGGRYRNPILVSRIVDKNGNVLETFTSDSTRALSDRTAHELTDMMRGVVNQGTGRAIRTQFGIQSDVAGKTGTTQNNADGWFILMHPQLVAGSWVGFNDARVTMRSDYWGQGAHTALPIVGDFYRQTLQARLVESSKRFPKPKESFFASLLDKVHDLLGWNQGEPASQPSRAKSVAPSHAPDSDTMPRESVTELERIITQAQEASPIYTASPRIPEEASDEQVTGFDDVPPNGNAGNSTQGK